MERHRLIMDQGIALGSQHSTSLVTMTTPNLGSANDGYQQYGCGDGVNNRNVHSESNFEWEIKFRSFVSRYIPVLRSQLQSENSDENDSALITTVLSAMSENTKRWIQEQRLAFLEGRLAEDRIRVFQSSGLLPVLVQKHVANQQPHQSLMCSTPHAPHQHNESRGILCYPGLYYTQTKKTDLQQQPLSYLLQGATKTSSTIGDFETNKYLLRTQQHQQQSSNHSLNCDAQQLQVSYRRHSVEDEFVSLSFYNHTNASTRTEDTVKGGPSDIRELSFNNRGENGILRRKMSKDSEYNQKQQHQENDTDSTSSPSIEESASPTNRLSPIEHEGIPYNVFKQVSAFRKRKKRKHPLNDNEGFTNRNQQDDLDSQDIVESSKEQERSFREKTGRWSPQEHNKFLEGLGIFGKKWTKIADFIGTRTAMQVRTHAQKYFQKLEKLNNESNADGDDSFLGMPSNSQTETVIVSKMSDSNIRKKIKGSRESGEGVSTTAENSESTYLSDTEHEVASLLAGMSKNRNVWM